MIRPVFTELALFLAPFVVYAIYLVATKSALLTLASWPPKVLATLGICALVLMIGSFVYLSHFSGSPPGSTYEPAHVEDGKFVPGGWCGERAAGFAQGCRVAAGGCAGALLDVLSRDGEGGPRGRRRRCECAARRADQRSSMSPPPQFRRR
jgi:hypothetical protein